MKTPLWWTLYKFAMVLLLLFSCTLLTIDPISIIGIILAFLLWGAQTRREKTWRQDQHNRNLVEALKNFPLDKSNATWQEKI